MNAVDLIAKRRDGLPHSPEEFDFLARGAAAGSIPDYQLAAWLMAAYLNPLSPQETADLTEAMANSGRRLDLTGFPGPTLDKHSTGGVGDKTTIVLLPLLAACGVTMVKMSGRGLGITGGTVDKLASIPGFRIDLSPQELSEQAARIGVALTGQTPDLAPADKALYALRDVTATVSSVPLIVSSILSKKLAGGSRHVLIDVKCGAGGFMPTLEDARALAFALKDDAGRVGLNLKVAITDMDQPLGHAAGNALEVNEAIEVLQGSRTGRFAGLCVDLAKMALQACGIASGPESAEQLVRERLSGRAALAKAKEWVGAQGGDLAIFDGDTWQPAKVEREMRYGGPSGCVSRVDARAVGLAVLELGGGRRAKADAIDPSVGVLTEKEVGDAIAPGDVLFRILASSEAQALAAESILGSAAAVSSKEVAPRPVILEEH